MCKYEHNIEFVKTRQCFCLTSIDHSCVVRQPRTRILSIIICAIRKWTKKIIVGLLSLSLSFSLCRTFSFFLSLTLSISLSLSLSLSPFLYFSGLTLCVSLSRPPSLFLSLSLSASLTLYGGEGQGQIHCVWRLDVCIAANWLALLLIAKWPSQREWLESELSSSMNCKTELISFELDELL